MKKIVTFILLLTTIFAFSQTELVFVYFKDKPNASIFLANPLSELSVKSIERRNNLGITITEQDAPIEPIYIQNIVNLGFTVIDKSKWLNGVAVNATSSQITLLENQPFVLKVESFVKKTSSSKVSTISKKEKFQNTTVDFNYGNTLSQINQINLRTLHVQGFTGSGVGIAVIDTGFPTVNTGSAFARIRNNNQIKEVYNFISKNTDVYNTSLNTHGTNCLGIIGGYIDGVFVGSAPDSDYYLYATEIGNQEIPEEELYWIEAAEEADRKGVDIISSSLGYGNFFDDTRYNYNYSQMNGSTSFVARGAQIAAEKGIIVMIAAGNEGNAAWHYIITPADNQKVFTIGAVDSIGNASAFTSFGPNSVGILKPDASARGTGTYYTYNNGSFSGNGTSYSTPLSAGGVACLLQAIPKTTDRENIKTKLKENASLYPSFDYQKGYGILNFGNVLNTFLRASNFDKDEVVKIYPNPTKNEIQILSSQKIDEITLYNSLGQKILVEKTNPNKINLEHLPREIYYVKMKLGNSIIVKSIIKE